MFASQFEKILEIIDRSPEKIEKIISLLPGLDRIEFLQMHPNVEIYRRAYDIIDRFFGPATEEADSTVAPVVSPGHFEFHPPALDSGAGAPFKF